MFAYPGLPHFFPSNLRASSGYRTASYDWDYEKSGMNFLGSAGFLRLSSIVSASSPRPPSSDPAVCSRPQARFDHLESNAISRPVLGGPRLQQLGGSSEGDVLAVHGERPWKSVLGMGQRIVLHDISDTSMSLDHNFNCLICFVIC